MKKWIFITALVLLAPMASSARFHLSSTWLEHEADLAYQKILAASPPEGAPGSIIASPSRTAPNYYFHWVRDAALTMDTLVSVWQTTTPIDQKAFLRQRILAYLDFSRSNQLQDTLTGLGEPKFEINGQPFSGPWGRPQNDGSALRAITAMHFVSGLQATGEDPALVIRLYGSHLPADTLIKADLEYVAHHWRDPSFDLWEEVLGDHFFTRMVQRKALRLGSELASKMNDPGAAAFYAAEASRIEASLEAFWDNSKGYVVATRNQAGGLEGKASNLDAAVLLGALHGGMEDGFFDVSDNRIQQTLAALNQQFAALYPLNQRGSEPGVALGRYPEDVYSGSDFRGGNPWVLITLAAAEANYRLAATDCKQSLAWLQLGDAYANRVSLHANPDGSLSEQIDRNSGYMVSAENLTWNYAAVLSAAEARSRARGLCP